MATTIAHYLRHQHHLDSTDFEDVLSASTSNDHPAFSGELDTADRIDVTPEALEKAFLYRVPITTDDGACAASKDLAPEPFDLGRELFGTTAWREQAMASPVTQTLLHLQRFVQRTLDRTGVDWLGVYRLHTDAATGERYLVKLAYVGRPSRAIFPLNDLFHDISNNTWVAMEGTAKLIQDVSAYTGPYYACDGQVQSELCAPIFDTDGTVLGILDAESFHTRFFDARKIHDIFMACIELGQAAVFKAL